MRRAARLHRRLRAGRRVAGPAGRRAACAALRPVGDRPATAGSRCDFQSLAWQQESVDGQQGAGRRSGTRATRTSRSRTSREAGTASTTSSSPPSRAARRPDIIHDASDDLADFAYGGYLADLRRCCPPRLKDDIPQRSWDTATFGDGVYGVPFLQEPRVLIANTKLLNASGVRIPTPEQPWSWAEFEERHQAAERRPATYGVAWPLKEPVSATLNLVAVHRRPDSSTAAPTAR